MADFELSIPTILEHEGGYVNDPNDPGGETKYGISKRVHPEINIEHLTEEHAKAIYHRDYWQYDCIESQAVATKLLDIAVNMGPKACHGLLQRALEKLGVTIAQFGHKFTDAMCDAVNAVDAGKLLVEIRSLQRERYDKLIEKNPALAKFRKGWMKRVDSC